MIHTTVASAESSLDRRSLLAAAVVTMAGLMPTRSSAAAPKAKNVPPFVQRGLPGAFHVALDPLQGQWRVEKKIFIAIGTKDRPAVSSGMTCTRRWVAGHRHLEDVTSGS